MEAIFTAIAGVLMMIFGSAYIAFISMISRVIVVAFGCISGWAIQYVWGDTTALALSHFNLGQYQLWQIAGVIAFIMSWFPSPAKSND